MPVKDWSLYPDNWNAIARAVKVACDWRCQICGLQCRRPGELFDTHRRTMSVMHLDHCPSNVSDDNLRGACSKCHLQYDARHHAESAAETRRRRKVEAGQEELEL